MRPLLIAMTLALGSMAHLSAHGDHIYHPKPKPAASKPTLLLCIRDHAGQCTAESVDLQTLSGQWHGNLTVTDIPAFRVFARSQGLCKDAKSCAQLSPYLSYALTLQQGYGLYTLKTFRQASAGIALTGHNSLRLTPAKDGFMIGRRNDLKKMQIRMQLYGSPNSTLLVKIFTDETVVAHGSVAGFEKSSNRVAQK